MDEIGKREFRMTRRLLGSAVSESREPLLHAADLARRLPWTLWCALTGLHSWGEWRPSATPFVPRENRYCRRCGGREYRGSWPGVKVVGGSMTPSVTLRWSEE